ncbi:DNA polymerase III subunit alpha [Pediococcus claussenii]|uniref:DNA polymerase III subunit alpha n=1 Tax=Pediococcus claussenii (strain ATCC BAA-344 / DSM 14800 / JCM 18046 / KCTC 3811 / LMG 21948 / P06) TaxID=701521 RepID=G8PD26_PEDCP|nr:DNA polymerase III subunit alpha [Pediococcus claussenii]AEV95161.1 DNA polymerase III, alpha subunit [Pediococcus claussenii ATCC BAA-344]KRN19656.1 dnaE protein [Pediococcus claussenii]
MNFTPLQITSSYSLLQSSIQIKKLVAKAKERGFKAISLADTNVLYGTIEFYQECIKNNIKPLVGLQIGLNELQMVDHDFPLLLFAENKIGYQNLVKISSLKMTNQNSNLTITDIAGLENGLKVIIPATHSELIDLIERGERERAESLLQTYLNVFSKDNVVLGVNLKQSNILRRTVHDLGNDFNLKCVPLPEVNYLDSDEYFATQVLKDIDSGETIRDVQNLVAIRGDDFLKNHQEFLDDFSNDDFKDDLKNLEELVDGIDLKLEFSKPQLPDFTVNQEESSINMLKRLCQESLAIFFQTNSVSDEKIYTNRLKSELKVIESMGFADYFLIIHDVIDYAHSDNIITGPGRGSAAGSLVAYLLSITSVDPIKFGLLFERFLNPERHQMPDIDLDIPDNKRDKVLEYVHQKYGHQRVAQIITFGTLAAKQAIRDVARVFGMLPNQINQISKLIPNQLNITLERSIKESVPLQNFVNDSEKNRAIFETARKIEGLPRHYSTHAAGIVLSERDIVEFAPIQSGNDGMLMVQYSKNYVEQVGLLKMDFLGLRNLSLLAEIIDDVKKVNSNFEIEKISLEDSDTLALFQRADTSGVFQFESAGIRNFLRKMRPDSFSLIVAVNALYRPGPMQNIDSFIKRKDGLEKFNIQDKILENILGETFGILVYQEQVMQVASEMGGFTLGEADLLRRAMSKKKSDVIKTMENKFIEGSKKNGFSVPAAERVYAYIESFANYGFNKSHAVAYSKLAFQLAYLKTHFSGQFYKALLNSVMGGNSKTREYIQEVKRLGISVEAPDINKSLFQYSFNENKIIMGLQSIKGLRKDFIKEVLSEREKNGKFTTVDSLLRRVGTEHFNQDTIERLIYSGALDHFGYNRAELLEYLPELLESLSLSKGSMDLFERLTPKVIHQKEINLQSKLEWEEDLLGTYVSAHPVERYKKTSELIHSTKISEVTQGQTVKIIALIRNVRLIRTKKGEQMAFITISDETGSLDGVIFPNAMKTMIDISSTQVVVLSGKVSNRNEQLQLVVNTIQTPEIFENTNKRWNLIVPSRQNTALFQSELMTIFKKHHGQIPVTLTYEDTGEKNNLGSNFNLDDSRETKESLGKLLGIEKIFLK